MLWASGSLGAVSAAGWEKMVDPCHCHCQWPYCPWCKVHSQNSQGIWWTRLKACCQASWELDQQWGFEVDAKFWLIMRNLQKKYHHPAHQTEHQKSKEKQTICPVSSTVAYVKPPALLILPALTPSTYHTERLLTKLLLPAPVQSEHPLLILDPVADPVVCPDVDEDLDATFKRALILKHSNKFSACSGWTMHQGWAKDKVF